MEFSHERYPFHLHDRDEIAVVASASTDAFAIADLYAVLEAVPPRFRPNASWLLPLEVINSPASSPPPNNYHASLTDLAGATPSRLIGKPLREASGMDGTITATQDNHVALVGDFRRGYTIVDRIGATIETVPHLMGANSRPTGQRGAFLDWRVGADVVIDNAIRMLNIT